MTAAQIQARVDAWLAAHTKWIAAENARARLLAQWALVTREFGADSAAATGVLLGLVREAHGNAGMFTVALVRDGGRWEVWARGSDDGPVSWGASEADALLAALEAAP